MMSNLYICMKILVRMNMNVRHGANDESVYVRICKVFQMNNTMSYLKLH